MYGQFSGRRMINRIDEARLAEVSYELALTVSESCRRHWQCRQVISGIGCLILSGKFLVTFANFCPEAGGFRRDQFEFVSQRDNKFVCRIQ